jgi:hypothetical protein
LGKGSNGSNSGDYCSFIGLFTSWKKLEMNRQHQMGDNYKVVWAEFSTLS